MMGSRNPYHGQFLYSCNLEEHVPESYLLRGIDRFLDLKDLRQHLTSFSSHTGDPAIDPELMIRMLIIGYSFGIRSERQLCEEVDLNLAYRWFCRLGFDGRVPDRTTFSRNRHGRFRGCFPYRRTDRVWRSVHALRVCLWLRVLKKSDRNRAPVSAFRSSPRP